MSNKAQALKLISEMIDSAEAVDAKVNRNNPDPSQPRGEGYFTFHLKQVKNLVEKLADDNSSHSSPA